MKTRRTVTLLSVVFVSVSGCRQFAMDSHAVEMSETSLREKATHIVNPSYPPKCLQEGLSGVSVVRIVLTQAGAIAKLKPLDAPCPEVGEAMVRSIQQWTFDKQALDAVHAEIRSKITFYFVIDSDGSGRVLSPADAPDFQHLHSDAGI